MTNDNGMNAEEVRIDDTNYAAQPNGQTENEQPVKEDSQSISMERELQEIYAQKQKMDANINENKRLLLENDKQLKRINRQYRALKRSRGRTVVLCIFLLAGIVAVSSFVAMQLISNIDAKDQSWLQHYNDQYIYWAEQTINMHNEKVRREYKSAYNRAKEEKRKQPGRLSEDNRDEINTYISSLDRVVDGLRSSTMGAVTCYTNTDVYEMQNYTMGGVSTTVFPGAVLKGDSLFQGNVDYTLLPLERSPMYLISDQIGGNSAKIENMNYQGEMEFLNSCAVKNEGQAAKKWNYYMQVFKSSKELKASLGIELPGVADFGFDSSTHTESSSVAVIYKQLHYTVSAEPHKNAADYFLIGSDMAALGDYEPAYVSSVDYGRMIVVLVQGNMSSQELGVKVGACIEGVNISAGLTNICMNSEMTSQIYQYGGEQKDAGLITDTSKKEKGLVEKWNDFWNGSEDRETLENRINDFIQSDAPAVNSVPIGYTLKYLTDNSFVPAMMVTNQESILIPSDSVVKKVMITMGSPVNWDVSGMTGMLISKSADQDLYQYEFLWNSNGASALRGEAENGMNVGFNLLEFLPTGKSNIYLGQLTHENSFMSKTNEDVYADVSISNY